MKEFNKQEYTTQGFIKYLSQVNKKFQNKNPSGKRNPRKRFTKDDIGQYLIRGHIPYRYGGNKITSKKVNGLRVIYLHLTEQEVLSNISKPDLSGKKPIKEPKRRRDFGKVPKYK